MRKLFGAFAGLAILALSPAAAQDVTLRISHYLPPGHGFQTDFLGPWAEDLKARSGGRIAYEIFPGPSAFGDAARQADQVRAGVVDVALGLAGIPRGRFPATSVIELPFLVEHADSGSKALWALHKEGALGGEYDDFHVLALYVHNGGLFHTRAKPVESLADLRGLRMRSPGPAASAMLESLGASPVGMPPAQIYENLQKGVLDGLVTTWDLVGAIKLNELLCCHTDARAYTAAFYVVMNKQTYERMPDDLKAMIDETTGEALVAKFGDWWARWDASGRADAEARGNAIVPVDQATRAAWLAELEPMIDAYLAELEAGGAPQARALYARAQALVAQFDAEAGR